MDTRWLWLKQATEREPWRRSEERECEPSLVDCSVGRLRTALEDGSLRSGAGFGNVRRSGRFGRGSVAMKAAGPDVTRIPKFCRY